MAKDPCKGVVCVVDDQVLKKDVLSQEEIQKLMDTHYLFEKENVRNAFIFCLYTGMRFCDVKDLRYSNIDYANKLLRFEQDKTKGHSARSWVTIPLNVWSYSSGRQTKRRRDKRISRSQPPIIRKLL